jgi:hypothetical protein
VRTARRPEVPDIRAPAALRWVAIEREQPVICPVMRAFAKIFTEVERRNAVSGSEDTL